MVVDELPAIVERCRRDTGRPPKLIYSIVNFSNPSGLCLAAERRAALAEISARFRVPVLEDDPYGELRYRGRPAPTVFASAPGGGSW